MAKSRAVVPLALVAILSGALLHIPFTGGVPVNGQTATPGASETTTPNESALRPPSDGELDTLDVLAESLAVDVSTEGLKKRVKEAVRTLRLDSKSTTEERETAVSDLQAFFNLPIRGNAPRLADAKAAVKAVPDRHPLTPASEPTEASRPFLPEAGVDVVDRFLSGYFDQDALRLEHPKDEAKLLAEDFERLAKTPLKLAILQGAAKAQKTDVRFLVATLPDPIDSYTGWQFDPMLDAITQAIAASD